MTAHACVQPRHLFSDGGVQFLEREEAAVAQAGDDPALYQEDGRLDLGLVLMVEGMPIVIGFKEVGINR
jgi:hypothetical protein